jgi:probable rRNA maturation factor
LVEVTVEQELGAPELEGVDLPGLTDHAEQLLGLVGMGESELSLMLCDDETIRSLNAQWRGKDSPTDVLSFPQEEALSPGQFAQPPPLLGDVVISFETAARQAAELGHSLEHELRALLVHGLLHLLGYDHEPPHDPAPMRAREIELLGALGLPGAAALTERAR